MKNNSNNQQNPDKSGSKANQKSAEGSTKNEAVPKGQSAKKGKHDENSRVGSDRDEQSSGKRNSGDSRSMLSDVKTGKQDSKKS